MLRCTSVWANTLLLLILYSPLMLAQRSPHEIQRVSATNVSEGQLVIRQVKISGSKDSVEIEVDASGRITPQPQMLTGPDRLVLDFANAVPGSELRSQSIYVGAIKDIRAGLFRSKPPITRLVIDLDSPETYQIFPDGRTVMIKMNTAAAARTVASVDPWREPALKPVAPAISAAIQAITPDDPPKPPLDVEFVNGLLSIKANKVTLAEILRAVQRSSGAEISIAPGADQEKVVSNLGPAPADEVLTHLLNGSRFNFLILNSASDPKKLDRVILTPRTEDGPIPLPPLQTPDPSPQPEPAVSQPVEGQTPSIQGPLRPDFTPHEMDVPPDSPDPQ